MLFDLRSPGRRFAIKIIYGALALLLGGGLVLFGIGSGTQGGGLFDALSSDSGKLSDDAFIKRADAQEKRTVANPTAANYAELARLRVQSAEVDEKTGVFTKDGRKQLVLADRAWTAHLQKAGDKPDARAANVIQIAYDPAALNQPQKGYTAMEVVVNAQGSKATPQQYVTLAYWAYLAKNTRQAKLAGEKALELTPKDERANIKSALDAYAAQAKEASGQTTTTPG
ncbi:MAG TPA: hypothetical protein VNT22_09065 [Baekduia sp.]|nr:hypothetical protein [Baekduia sp.]